MIKLSTMFTKVINRLNRRDLPLINFKSTPFRLFLFLFVAFSLAFTTQYIFAADLKKDLLNYIEANETDAPPSSDKFIRHSYDVTIMNIFNTFIPIGIFKPLLEMAEFLSLEELSNYRYALGQGGFLGTATHYISQLNTIPVSGVEYIASVKDEFLGKPAYAQFFGSSQSTGFVGLQRLLPLWKSFRNMVYILSAIVFIVIGIMIVLRVKISPQAVISVQSAIPQIITTLILVTFSYAIAGLLVDLMYLIQAIVIALFFAATNNTIRAGGDTGLFDQQVGSGFPLLSDLGDLLFEFINKASALIGISIGGSAPFTYEHLVNPDIKVFQQLAYRAAPSWLSMMLMGGLLGSIIMGLFLGGFGFEVLGGFGGGVLTQAGQVIGLLGGGIVGLLLIPLVISITLGIWLIKMYFGMFKAYVTIIFKIILAPLEIGMGAIPNSKTGFNTWLWDLIGHLAIFPVINIFLIVLNLIIDALYVNPQGANTPLWTPGPLNWGNELSTIIVAGAIGLAGIALLSKLPDLVPQVIFALKPSPFGQAIGQELGTTNKWILSRTGDAVAPGSFAGTFMDGFVPGSSAALSNMLKGK